MKDNDIEVKTRKKESLISRLFGLKKKIKTDSDQREHVEEIRTLEQEIKQVDQELEEAVIRVSKERVAEYEREALQLQSQRRAHVEQIEKIDARFFELDKLASEAIPRKKVQVSSRQWVRISRVVQMPRLVLHALAPPTTEFDPKIETDLISAVPQILQQHLADGWALEPGEEVIPEPLDEHNSVERPMFNLPDIFSNFDMGSRWITDAFSRGLLIKR